MDKVYVIVKKGDTAKLLVTKFFRSEEDAADYGKQAFGAYNFYVEELES